MDIAAFYIFTLTFLGGIYVMSTISQNFDEVYEEESILPTYQGMV